MKNLSELKEDFKNQTLDALSYQMCVFDYYKNNPATEQLKEEILQLVDDENYLDPDMWQVLFEPARDMHQAIVLRQTYNIAQDFKEQLENEPTQVSSAVVARMAFSVCNVEPYNHEKEKIWLEVFNDTPDFKEELMVRKLASKKIKDAYLEKHKSFFDEMNDKKNLPIVQVIEVTVPILINTSKDVWDTKEFNQLAQEITTSFNKIGLHSTQPIMGQYCANSHAYFDNKNFIAVFECFEKIDDKHFQQIHENIMGDFTDGWGETETQRTILIGNKVVRLDFDTTESTLSVKDTNIKPKMK